MEILDVEVQIMDSIKSNPNRFTLIGHACPILKYPAKVIPIVKDTSDEGLFAIFLTSTRLSAYEISEADDSNTNDIINIESLYFAETSDFNCTTHILFAESSEKIYSCPIKEEKEFVAGYLQGYLISNLQKIGGQSKNLQKVRSQLDSLIRQNISCEQLQFYLNSFCIDESVKIDASLGIALSKLAECSSLVKIFTELKHVAATDESAVIIPNLVEDDRNPTIEDLGLESAPHLAKKQYIYSHFIEPLLNKLSVLTDKNLVVIGTVGSSMVGVLLVFILPLQFISSSNRKPVQSVQNSSSSDKYGFSQNEVLISKMEESPVHEKISFLSNVIEDMGANLRKSTNITDRSAVSVGYGESIQVTGWKAVVEKDFTSEKWKDRNPEYQLWFRISLDGNYYWLPKNMIHSDSTEYDKALRNYEDFVARRKKRR